MSLENTFFNRRVKASWYFVSVLSPTYLSDRPFRFSSVLLFLFIFLLLPPCILRILHDVRFSEVEIHNGSAVVRWRRVPCVIVYLFSLSLSSTIFPPSIIRAKNTSSHRDDDDDVNLRLSAQKTGPRAFRKVRFLRGGFIRDKCPKIHN